MAMELLYENLPDEMMVKVGQEMIGKYYQKKAGELDAPEFEIHNVILSDKTGGRVVRDWGVESDAEDAKENVAYKKIKPNVPEQLTRMEKDAAKVKKSTGQSLMSGFFKKK